MDRFTLADAGSMEQLLRNVIDQIGYLKGMKLTESDYEQTSNIEELLTVARQYDSENPEDPTLEGFLEATSLASDVDAIDSEAGRVTLMTLHAAKGLEFPHVFIIGVEQNLIPHERALKTNDPREYEEERRLLFVGITRAMEKLTLTQTRQRAFRGKTLHTIPSDFMREMSLSQINLTTSYKRQHRSPRTELGREPGYRTRLGKYFSTNHDRQPAPDGGKNCLFAGQVT
ncbi:MAG: 3'-5' exonuclease [Planctomycetaceae bacterium]